MKHKTAELQGALLNKAVAMALNWSFDANHTLIESGAIMVKPSLSDGDNIELFRPWELWAHGGPLIERDQISLWKGKWEGATARGMPEGWIAYIDADAVAYNGEARTEGRFTGNGPTPLIAAMRAYLASKFGDEVDLP